MRYFLGGLVSYLPLFLLISLWGIVRLLIETFTVTGGNGSAVPDGLLSLNYFLNAFIGIAITVAIFWFFVLHTCLAIRRCHDLGYTGWISLVAYVPYVGFIVFLVLLFKRGEQVANKYGDAPGIRGFWAEIFNA
jgi:uncharacterized membrane protein YhaH (DUF805 family)